MKKIRNIFVAIFTFVAIIFAVSCPSGNEDVKGTAKLVTSLTVSGAKNVEIEDTIFTIRLEDGAKFVALSRGLDVKSWFNPRIQGLFYRVDDDVKDGAALVRIRVSGIPEQSSAEPITIIVPSQMKESSENGQDVVTPILKNSTANITVSDYKEGQKTIVPLSKYSIGETPDKPVATLQNSLVVSGQQGLTFTTPYSARIKLDTGRFDALEAGSDASAWFAPIVDGLTYKVLNTVKKNSNSVEIQINGTPTTTSTDPIKITIPTSALIERIETPVAVLAGGSLSYNITNAAATAKLREKVTISGTSNITLKSVEMTILVEGATFKSIGKGEDVTTWITNPQIDGLKYTVKNALSDDLQKELTIEVSGTPKTGANDTLTITIPKSALVLPKDRENEIKEVIVNTLGSEFAIKGPTAEMSGDENRILSGRIGVEIEPFEITVNLSDITFKAIKKAEVEQEIANVWFKNSYVDGLNYSLKEDVAENSTSLTVVITGKPKTGADQLITMIIPKARFLGNSGSLSDISVKMKGAMYSISELTAKIDNGASLRIEGGKGLQMSPQSFTITLEGEGAKFNRIPSKVDNVNSWFGIDGSVPTGVTFALSANASESSSITLTASGIPLVTSIAQFSISIPYTYIKDADRDVKVTTNGARYDINDVSASVTNGPISIDGKKGVGLQEKDGYSIRVKVIGAKLKEVKTASFKPSEWISPLLDGLTYALSSDINANADTFTIVVSGTPNAQSSDILSIKIPKDYVVNAVDAFEAIGVDVNNSKYNIKESVAEIDLATLTPSSDNTITAVTNISKTTQSFNVKLINEKFVALDKDVDWFTDTTGLTFHAKATEGSTVATVTVSGVATKVSKAYLSGSIPSKDLQNNGDSLPGGLPIDTKDILYNVVALKLKTTETVTVSGSTGNVELNDGTHNYYELTVVFDNSLSEKVYFKEANESTLDATWINMVAGLEYKKMAIYSADKSRLVIRVSGKPTEENGTEIAITIPNAVDVIEGYSTSSPKNVTVDTQGSSYSIKGLFAQLDNKYEINGFKDKTITSQTFSINLVNSTFKKALSSDEDVATWFTIANGSTGGYQGLSYKIATGSEVSIGASSATITISGASQIAIPGVALVMIIPKDYLTNTTEDLKVDTRGSLYNIKEISASTNTVTVSGTQNVSIGADGKKITITLADGVQFKERTSSLNLNTASPSWMKIVDGLSYTLLSSSSRSSTAEILIKGTPTQTISEHISISIPSTYIDGMRENAPSIGVDTQGSSYAIDTLSASLDTKITVEGTKNVEWSSANAEFTINLNGAKFAPLSAGSYVDSWIESKVAGLRYKLKNSIPTASSDDTDSATIIIEGTPEVQANTALVITLPSGSIKDAANKTLVVDTKESRINIVDITAVVEDPKTIGGAKNTLITEQTIVVKLNGNTNNAPLFKSIASTTDVKSWFADSVPGLKYELQRNTSASASLSIRVYGTPTASSHRAVTITIPKDRINKYNGADVVVDTNGSIHNIDDLVASLTSNNNNVEGTRYISLSDGKIIEITLVGTTFNAKSGDVSSWFETTAVSGLTYTLTEALTSTSTVAKVRIAGTPREVTSRKAMQIIIPASDMKNADAAVIVNTSNAVYDIKEASAAISASQDVSGFRDIALSSTKHRFTLTLENVAFNARTSTDVKSWFTPVVSGLSYTLSKAISAGDKSVIVTISGTPSVALNTEAISITIPSSELQDADTTLFKKISVDTKSSSYTIEDWYLKSNEVEVKGTDSGVAIANQTFTITFDKERDGLYFNSSASISALDDTWISPILGGLTFSKAQVTNATKNKLTITVSGTPKATSSSPISITIPNAATYIYGYKNDTKTTVDVNTSGSRYNITSLYANLSSQALVTGHQYFTLTSSEEKILTVNLQGDAKFKNALTVGTDVKSWFTANHKGLSYTIASPVAENSNVATVKISGTPEVALTQEGLSMVIPASYLSGTAVALNVDTLGSYYTFTPITSTIEQSVVVNGSMNTVLKLKTIVLRLTGATFKARTATVDVASWFSHQVQGLSYVLQTSSVASDTASIIISGTPLETFSAPLALTIKDNSLITNYSSTAPNIVPLTNESRYAISSITASLVSSNTINGTKDITINTASRASFTINLVADDAAVTFKSFTSGTSVASWISGTKIDGLTYSLSANPSLKKQATIIVGGTPSTISKASFNITIPSSALNGDVKQDIPVDTGTSAYNIVDLTASSNSVTISGSLGTQIMAKSIEITLSGAQFKVLNSSTEDNVRSWFKSPVDGLKYTRRANTSQTNTITVDVTGTPTMLSTQAIEITIPQSAIVNADTTKSGVVVNTNSSKYAIGSITASLQSRSDIMGTREIAIASARNMTVTLDGATFKAVTASTTNADVSGWFTPTIAGLSYKLNNGITDGSTSAVITISGTPQATSSAIIQMEIPASYMKDAINSVLVDAKGSVYNIVEATASVNTKQTVSGVTNIALKDRQAFTVTLQNARFNAITSVADWFSPAIDGLTYTLASGVSAGSSSASIKIGGLPTVESSETLSIRIPRSAIQNASTSFGTTVGGTQVLSVDTKSSIYAISSASATIKTTTTITGVKDITPTSSQSFSIDLTAAKFSALNLTGSTARSWFTNPIDGLSYTITANSGASSATITVSGTPTVSANASIGMIIPKQYLTFDGNTASKDVVVDANGSVYNITSVSASITSSSAVIISGIKNVQITSQTLVVDLTNATFKNSSVGNVSSWISPVVKGLSYSFTRNTTTRGTITITGLPTSESSALISIDIPSSQITNASSSFKPLSVDTKSSHYTISGSEATITSALKITGTKGITLQNTSQSFKINLSGALFSSFTNVNVTSWVSNNNGLTYTGTSTSDGTSVTVTVSGTPTNASSAALVIVILTSRLRGTVSEPVVVNTKGLEYNIDEVSATISSRIQVNGILNKLLTSVSGTVVLSGNDATFTGLSTSTNFGTNTYIEPVLAGLTYKITNVATNGKSFTFQISGTPSVTSTSTIALTIPRTNIKGYTTGLQANITVDTKTSQYNINEASAKVTLKGSTTSAATVSAVQNVSLETAQTVQINLDAATFIAKSANTDVSTWFTNRIDGLTYRLESAITSSSTVAVVKIEGAPRVQSNERIVVKLPVGSTSLTKELTADSASSVYAITSASASIPAKITVKGSNGVQIANGTYQFTINLTGVKFASVSNLDVKSWFTPNIDGLEYRLTSALQSGATSATVNVYGTPTLASQAIVAITIKNSALKGAANLGDLVVDAKESLYAIESVSLALSKTVSINGFTNVPFTAGAYDFNMTLQGGPGFAALSEGTDISSWFTPVEGVLFKVKSATTAGAKTLSVAVSGTPKKGSTAHISVLQSALSLDTKISTSIAIDTKNSAFNIIDVTATLNKKVYLSGAKNIPISANSNNMFTVTLTGINFASLTAGEDVTGWITPSVPGLSFKVNTATGSASKTVTIKPDGTPTAISQNVMWTVTIPQGKLQGYTQNLVVDAKSSVYSIVDAEASLSATTNITGVKGKMISPTTLTIQLKNGLKFTSMSTSTDLISWFDSALLVPGLSYRPKSAVTTGSTSMDVLVTGTPEISVPDNAIKIVIPPNMVYYDDTSKKSTQSINVDTLSSIYSIVAANTAQTLNLAVTADVDIEPQVFEIYFRGGELNSIPEGTDITDWFSFEQYVEPTPDTEVETQSRNKK